METFTVRLDFIQPNTGKDTMGVFSVQSTNAAGAFMWAERDLRVKLGKPNSLTITGRSIMGPAKKAKRN